MSKYNRIKNLSTKAQGFPVPPGRGGDVNKDLSNYIAPVQLARIRQDILSWREAITEAENAWYPNRVKLQRLFIDTILNGHVEACIQKRRDLTLLRDFEFLNQDGTENEDVENLFKQEWFFNFLTYSIDALFFGYSLISLNDIIDEGFPKLKIIKRWNVSPDRFNVTNYVYSISGHPFMEGPAADWHVYVETPNEIGVGYCGNGLLYKVGIYEIFCRNLLGFNGDFVEMYSQPYRVGKTMSTSEKERGTLEQALQQMGSSGYAIIDPQDQIEFLETALGGTGYKGYDNLEKRCEQKISKIILGHADAIDSIPGKLGNSGEQSPADKALSSIQSRDGRFIENVVNGILIPKMRVLGFIIPDVTFCFSNDDEKTEERVNEDNTNLVTAQIAQTMKQAGLQMDAKYFEDRTGIKSTPVIYPVKQPAFKPQVQNKLREIYSKTNK